LPLADSAFSSPIGPLRVAKQNRRRRPPLPHSRKKEITKGTFLFHIKEKAAMFLDAYEDKELAGNLIKTLGN